MADESFSAVYPGSKINYTVSSYLLYIQQLQMKAKLLNKTGKVDLHKIKIPLNMVGKQQWNVHKVELALWSFHYTSQESVKMKRKTSADDNLLVKRQRIE